MYTQDMDPLIPGGGVPELNQSQLELEMNQSSTTLPPDMVFNESNVLSIIVYSILMVISAVGNITVLIILIRRSPRTRINIMLIHLAIADLMVTFLMMPLEIAWAATVCWKAGDFMCRLMAFFRVFGLYLSSFVLICISVDRYYAVIKPLQMSEGERRNKAMLLAAWIFSVICSAPQMAIFNVKAHPTYKFYDQCISRFSFGKYPTEELTYSLFTMFLMYAAPLFTVVFCYSSILREIVRRSRDSLDGEIYKMRRSSMGFLGRARTRTLKMTITIFLVFFVCWTPYYIMSMWYWLDRDSAENVDARVRRGLFIFASTNSCMNPLVYGAFNVRARTQGSNNRRTIINRSSNRKDFYSCGESLELPAHNCKARYSNHK